jgi:hypothetical protein
MGKFVKKKLLGLSLATTLSLSALDLTLIPDYGFVDGHQTFDVSAYGALVGSADFKVPSQGHMNYNEEAAGLFYNFYITPKNAITLGAGWTRQYLGWKENPAFNQKNFEDAVINLSYTTYSLDPWRWIMSIGANMNLNHFNLWNRTFYTQLLWGRYRFQDNVGFHIGFIGQGGVDVAKYLPIFGFDWYFHPKWSIVAVYPAEGSFNFHIDEHWKISLIYRSMGGWYHANHRVGPDETIPNAVFTTYSSGVDIGIYEDYENCKIGLYGGYNFGGWVWIGDSNGHSGNYYKFENAPYGALKVAISF